MEIIKSESGDPGWAEGRQLADGKDLRQEDGVSGTRQAV